MVVSLFQGAGGFEDGGGSEGLTSANLERFQL